MGIGRLHHVVLDCPAPLALAGFWSALLGDPITYRSDDWVVVSTSTQASGLAFQRAPHHRPSTWPDPQVPQQLHLDVMVEEVDAAIERAVALGARRIGDGPVLADPAGHPFCLVRRPGWADPISDRARPSRVRRPTSTTGERVPRRPGSASGAAHGR